MADQSDFEDYSSPPASFELPPVNAQVKLIILLDILSSLNEKAIPHNEYRRRFINESIRRLNLTAKEAAAIFVLLIELTKDNLYVSR